MLVSVVTDEPEKLVAINDWKKKFYSQVNWFASSAGGTSAKLDWAVRVLDTKSF